jgi:aspartate-semialdehyde dehydrogenase/adenine nucleotide transporter 17
MEKKARMYKRRVRREFRRATGFLTTTVPNLYAGVGASLLLTVNPTIQYTMYEQLRQRALKGLSVGRRKPVTELPVFEAIVIAALSKAAATVATYPLIRAKVLQKAATNPKDQQSNQQKNRRNASSKSTDFATLSLLQIMADLKKREGYAGWYKGLNAQLTKTVVASAIGLSIKEKSFRASQLLVAAFSTR